MEFFKNIGKAVGGAASYLGEKNRRAAQLSRIRSVIRAQERAAEREYLALGRYYYHNLRDKHNDITEAHCASLDTIEAQLDSALTQLEKFYSGDPAREEVTLEDVSAYDSDPTQPETPAPQPAPAEEAPATQEKTPEGPAAQQAAPVEENDSLPFEG